MVPRSSVEFMNNGEKVYLNFKTVQLILKVNQQAPFFFFKLMEFDMVPTFVFISCYFCIMCVMNFSKSCHPPKLTPRACRTVKVSDHDSIRKTRQK